MSWVFVGCAAQCSCNLPRVWRPDQTAAESSYRRSMADARRMDWIISGRTWPFFFFFFFFFFFVGTIKANFRHDYEIDLGANRLYTHPEGSNFRAPVFCQGSQLLFDFNVQGIRERFVLNLHLLHGQDWLFRFISAMRKYAIRGLPGVIPGNGRRMIKNVSIPRSTPLCTIYLLSTLRAA